MAGIEERGIFWPRGTEIPTGQLTPDNGIGGLLTIDLGGKIRLELDSIFPRRGGSLVAILSPEQDPSAPTSIEGVLSKGRHHVLLLATRKVGGSFNPAWVSHENYMAIHALLCKHPFPRDGNDLKFSEISSNLIGFEEWIGLGSIEFVEDGEKRTATYERPKNPTYNISGLTLLVEFDLRSPYPSTRLHDVTLTECAYLKMKFDDPLSLDDAIREHLGLQDLLTLLTDTEYTLEWPQLTLSGEDSTCTAYFGRHASSGKPPEMHHCLGVVRK
jgi:hypothetical protein